MGTNTQFRMAAIVAARDLFIVNGYEQTTMNQIAEALHVTKPVLYSHFDNKLALLEAVIDYALDSTGDTLTQLLLRREISFEKNFGSTA